MFQIKFGGRGSGKTALMAERALEIAELLDTQPYKTYNKPCFVMDKHLFNFGLKYFPDNFKYIEGKRYVNNLEVLIIGGTND